MLRDLEGDRDILLDEQDREAARMQRADRVEDLLHDRRRKAERRLIEHDQLGTSHQAAAYRKHRLLASGHRSGKLAPALGKPRKHRVHLRELALARRACAGQHRAGLEVLLDGQRWKDLTPFRDLADSEIADLM